MFLLGVPRPGGGDRALIWCLLEVRGSRDPFSGTPAEHGGGGGAAPSQAARLLLLRCFTVGGKLVKFFFHSFLFARPTHSLL